MKLICTFAINLEKVMILTAEQIRECEKLTMEQEPILSIDLMERAASNFIKKLNTIVELKQFSSIAIFCGPGNNGGDGWAIARLLAKEDYHIIAINVSEKSHYSPDCDINRKRAEQISKTSPNLSISPFSTNLKFDKNTLIIDAIFGIGLSKPIIGFYAEVIQFINQLNAIVVAVDVPSGLYVDTHTPKTNISISATYTITFQFLKQAFVLAENENRVGNCHVADIGLIVPENIAPPAKLITLPFVSQFIKKRKTFTHKGEEGTGLLIAGSYTMPGAAVLATKAALRGGIGKVIVHTPKSVMPFIINAIPEAILQPDKDDHIFTSVQLENLKAHTIAIGCGLGKEDKSVVALKNLLEEVRSPVILDADALNILADNKTWLAFLPPNSILTPHIKEFERLTGKADNDFARWDKVKEFAMKYEVVVILKGAYSLIALPDGKLLVNCSGNPGMATAGSGDVLTGLLLALTAQGYSFPIAAIVGTFIHGLAGDLALKNQSLESLIASDIINYFGNAFKSFKNEKK